MARERGALGRAHPTGSADPDTPPPHPSHLDINPHRRTPCSACVTAMGRSCSFLLLLFLLFPWPRATEALLQYRHDCGELGMQLLVLPPHGRTVRFKVLGEWGDSLNPLGVLDLSGIPPKAGVFHGGGILMG